MTKRRVIDSIYGFEKVLGAPSGFNLKSSRVLGPVKECPGKCISPGYLAHGSLIFFVTELSDPTRSPPFAFLTNCVLVVPHSVHIPLSIGLLFLLLTFRRSLVSVFLLHFSQHKLI